MPNLLSKPHSVPAMVTHWDKPLATTRPNRGLTGLGTTQCLSPNPFTFGQGPMSPQRPNPFSALPWYPAALCDAKELETVVSGLHESQRSRTAHLPHLLKWGPVASHGQMPILLWLHEVTQQSPASSGGMWVSTLSKYKWNRYTNQYLSLYFNTEGKKWNLVQVEENI